MKSKNDALVLGAALFSMFFGAGNLIFPPFLGLLAGGKWAWALFGFFLTGIGLPLLGIIASAKSGGDVDKLGRRVSPGFSKFLGITIVLAIGPLLAIPRTGATAFEIGVLPTMPNGNPIIFSIIYFAISLFLVIKPNEVVDKIGKVLTPALLLLLAIIIIKGIISPMGKPVEGVYEIPFSQGFISGYQTMDALASILFGGIITSSLIQKGYDEKEQIEMTIKSGLIAVAGLTFVYGGLGYLGATAGSLFSTDIDRVDLIVNISENLLASFGKMGLGIVVALACLTTTVGLTATVGQYFNKISDGKLKYETVVIITTIFSAIMSVKGVEFIIVFAEPILTFMYPVVIVMILLTVIPGYEPSKNTYRYAVFATLVVSILELLNNLGIWTTTNIINHMPLASWGFAWLLPAIIGFIIGKISSDRMDIQIN